MSEDTRTRILEAARRCLLADGFSSLSTRNVAKDADVPLSQIHYHFGSKEEMILSLLRAENDRLLERQTRMYQADRPLSEQWEIACGYFEEDLASGYVRVIQEMTAAGWSSQAVRKEMQQIWGGWMDLLLGVVREAELTGVGLGAFSPGELVALVSAAWVGAESLILLGLEDETFPFRDALRSVGAVIKLAEEGVHAG